MNDSAERVVTPLGGDDDQALEASLRPRTLREYIGQQAMREKLEIYLEAARRRGDALDHVLIFGPPGLGKTTLAHVIAHEMGVNLRQTSGPVLERAGDLAALLTNLKRGLRGSRLPSTLPRMHSGTYWHCKISSSRSRTFKKRWRSISKFGWPNYCRNGVAVR
jgi:hypothetical protein